MNQHDRIKELLTSDTSQKRRTFYHVATLWDVRKLRKLARRRDAILSIIERDEKVSSDNLNLHFKRAAMFQRVNSRIEDLLVAHGNHVPSDLYSVERIDINC